MGHSLAAAEGVRDRLRAGSLAATLDVREVLGLAPCVLVPPPIWDDWAADGSPMFTWRLVAISAQGLGNADAWAELDDLVSAVADVLDISRAEPIAYALPGGGQPPSHPAYAITYTGS